MLKKIARLWCKLTHNKMEREGDPTVKDCLVCHRSWNRRRTRR